MPTTKILDIGEIALFRVLGRRLVDTAIEGNRIALLFDDTDGQGAAILKEHRAGRVETCSVDFCDAYAWAKNRIFAARRDHGSVLA